MFAIYYFLYSLCCMLYEYVIDYMQYALYICYIFLLAALDVSLTVLSLFIGAHGTDVSVGV